MYRPVHVEGDVEHIFDLPRVPKLYEERQNYLDQLRRELPSHVQIIKQIKCEGEDHLRRYYNDVLSNGGEGVVLCKPKSVYQSGRVDTMYKVKVR